MILYMFIAICVEISSQKTQNLLQSNLGSFWSGMQVATSVFFLNFEVQIWGMLLKNRIKFEPISCEIAKESDGVIF